MTSCYQPKVRVTKLSVLNLASLISLLALQSTDLTRGKSGSASESHCSFDAQFGFLRKFRQIKVSPAY